MRRRGRGASDGKFQTKCDKYISGKKKKGIESGDRIKGMWWENIGEEYKYERWEGIELI
jgi:hypothetical protein